MPGAKLGSKAKKVPDGYVLNGAKCFISNGSISTYHTAMMPQDRARPLETFTTFLVPTDTPGFSFGRDEHKMGQKGCPASEMIYEDCFVPDEYVLGSTDAAGTERMLDLMGLTRLCVGAISTGVARGAYERAVTFARERSARGKPLINQQWAQMILSQMLMNVMTARATYMEADYCDLLNGTGKVVPLRRGGFRIKQVIDRVMSSERAKRFTDKEENLRKIMIWTMESGGMDTSLEATFGAWAKAKCSDYAMLNAGFGVDLMGKAGLRQDEGMEKIFRDAKLLQIYEGTNEHCRQALFSRYIARKEPGIKVFGRDVG
jgi:acyl-CoA dehydrogenase